MSIPHLHRSLDTLSRVVLATLGSYALAAAAAAAISRAWPDGGRAAVSMAELAGFGLFGAAAILAFSMRSSARAWALIGGGAVVLAIAAAWLGASPR